MSTIKLRDDYDATRARRLAARAKDPDQARRLLALAAVYEGRSRGEAAALAGMDRQTLRDWALRFNALGPDGLINRPPPGARRCLSPPQEQALAALVEAGPEAAGLKGVARWRCCDLQAAIVERFGVRVHERTVGKLLKRLGFSHITTRPQHYRQDVQAQVDFKKLRGDAGAYSGWPDARTPVEVWFQDEMRPRQVADLRTGCAYLFGAICPERRVGAAWACEKANTAALQLQLDEIALQVAPGAHAVVVLDQAGWHTTQKLRPPDNLSLLPLPPRSPELNPAENVWHYLRQRFLSNTAFDDYDAIIQAICEAWNKFMAEPDRIQSIGHRQWANAGSR